MKEAAKMPETIGRRWTFAGVADVARRIGCSREHLSRVLHGKRKANPNIARTLRHMGVKVEVA